MKKSILALLLLSGCAGFGDPETVYVPQEVDKPVEVTCKAPFVSKPVDLLAGLSPTTSLTAGMKSCLAQRDYDIGYQTQLEAAISACQ
jgi:hypothetical protein